MADDWSAFKPVAQQGDQWTEFKPEQSQPAPAPIATAAMPPINIPPSLLARFGAAAKEGGLAGFGDSPLGITPQDRAKLSPAPGAPRSFASDLQLQAVQSLDMGVRSAEALFRGVNAAIMGTGAMIGQGFAEVTGANEAESARARRDWAQALSIAALLAGAHTPMTRSGPHGAGEVVGHIPSPEDFSQAAKVLNANDPAVIAKLQKLYDELGVHPAEVAADASRDEKTKASVISPNPADTPYHSGAWDEVPDAYSFHGYEPTFPANVDKSIYDMSMYPKFEARRMEAYFENVPKGDNPKTANPIPPFASEAISGETPMFAGMEFKEAPQGIWDTPELYPQRPYFSYTHQDQSTFSKYFNAVTSTWQKTFQPELVSDAALQADPLFARYKAALAADKDGVVARAEEEHQFWRGKTDAERFGYIDKLERGKIDEMPDELQERASRHRYILNKAAEIEKEYGSRAGYIEDYFQHIWQNPDQARGFVNAKTAQLGPAWFQKERTFDTVKEGMEAGLRLKSTNPEDLVTARLLSSADMKERVSLLRGLQDLNLAAKAEGADPELSKLGWTEINAPDRSQWLLSPDIQYLWKNAVEAKGFWANEGVPGNIFRGWMALKNVWVPLKLALSAFHPLHVLHINFAEGLARAWTQIVKGGDVGGALESAMQGLYGSVAAAVPGMKFKGKAARVAWKIAAEDRTPEQKAVVELMKDGGFVPELSEQLRINAQRAFEDARDNADWIKTGPMALRRAIEIVQAPIFQEWIPSLKAAAYLNDAKALLERKPELLENATQRRAALRTIAKSIDNRYGEMFYGNLFWDRYIKDAGIGSFLSLGWNLGFAREFGGALLEPEFRLADRMINGRPTQTRATIQDAQNKLPFVIAYSSTAMLIGGMMTYGFTGSMPEGLDYFFPRVGGTNPDGTPRRVSTMFYTREVPMAMKHIEEHGGSVAAGMRDMIWNKTMFQPIKEMMQNRNYYGSDIWDENGPVYMQAWQAMKHVFGEQFSPISVTGAQRALLTGGQWYEALLAMLGFGPAPSYVENTATGNRIRYLYDRHVAPVSRPQEMGERSKTLMDIRNELLIAKRDGDRDGMQAASQKWMASGGSRQALSNMILGVGRDVSMFKTLPEQDQAAIMQQATPSERQKFNPYLKTNAAKRVADLMVEGEQARKAGNTVAANQAQQEVTQIIRQEAAAGHIQDAAAFRRSISDQLIARYAPNLSAVLSLPKKLRAQQLSQ